MKRTGIVLALLMACSGAQAGISIGDKLDISTDCMSVEAGGIKVGGGDCDTHKHKAKGGKKDNHSFNGHNNPGKGHNKEHK